MSSQNEFQEDRVASIHLLRRAFDALLEGPATDDVQGPIGEVAALFRMLDDQVVDLDCLPRDVAGLQRAVRLMRSCALCLGVTAQVISGWQRDAEAGTEAALSAFTPPIGEVS